jgi:arylsulfatase A-like enzyme
MFLYLHFMDVHEYAAPPEFKTFGGDDAGAYRAAIRWDDDALRRVREKLDDAGLLDDNVIVLASDHGEAFGENGKTGHARNVLTATLQTPLVMRFPFPVEPIRVKSQVRNIDIAPTLLELAGEPIPDGFDGRSLLPLLTGAEAEEDRVSLAALGTPLYRDASVQVSVTDGRWTFARNVAPDPHPGEFLFDRSVDPGENVNLIEREPEAASRMRALLDAKLDEGADPDVLESDVRIDPSIAERLRAMGYLE